MSKSKIMAAAGILCAIAAVVLLPIDIRTAVQYIRDAGAIGTLLFVGLYAAATVLVLPGSLLTLAAGFLYGPILGVAVVWPAAVIGASLSFVFSRWLVGSWVKDKWGHGRRFRAIDRAISERGTGLVLLLRLSPLVPFAALNYSLGLTRITFRRYVWASAVGMLPGTFLYVYLGSVAHELSELGPPTLRSDQLAPQLFFWGGLLATIAAVVVVTRKARAALQGNLDELGGVAAQQSSTAVD